MLQSTRTYQTPFYRMSLSRETLRHLSASTPKDDDKNQDTRDSAAGTCCTYACNNTQGVCTKNNNK